jgi:hypothetical protein
LFNGISEIKDFNFEYHSTQYSRIPEIDLYQYYYIPKDIAILDFIKKLDAFKK